MGARVLGWLRLLVAGLGLLLLLVTFTPLLRYWTNALSVPWRTDNRGIMIVLGGDIVAPDMIGYGSFWRAWYAIREWRTGRYSRIVLSGKTIGPLMRDFMVGQGVPAEAITVEDASLSTRENAVDAAQLLAGIRGPKVLVTSDFHMRRALGAFRKAGLDAAPLPVPDAWKRLPDFSQRWNIFCSLVLETVKLTYYRTLSWV